MPEVMYAWGKLCFFFSYEGKWALILCGYEIGRKSGETWLEAHYMELRKKGEWMTTDQW